MRPRQKARPRRPGNLENLLPNPGHVHWISFALGQRLAPGHEAHVGDGLCTQCDVRASVERHGELVWVCVAVL